MFFNFILGSFVEANCFKSFYIFQNGQKLLRRSENESCEILRPMVWIINKDFQIDKEEFIVNKSMISNQ